MILIKYQNVILCICTYSEISAWSAYFLNIFTKNPTNMRLTIWKGVEQKKKKDYFVYMYNKYFTFQRIFGH